MLPRCEVRREQFDLWRARRVVGHDCLDDALGLVLKEFRPECVLVRLRADGRAAFVSCIAFFDAFGSKREIVETCLGCNFDTFRSGFTEHWDGFHGRQVYNVEL